MVVQATKTRVNNFYSIQLLTEFDSNELSFIAAYGEPTIDVGGVITYDSSLTYTKASSSVLIRSQFPVSFGLSISTDGAAVAKVDAWSLAVRTSLQTVLTALMGNSVPNFPNTTVYSLH